MHLDLFREVKAHGVVGGIGLTVDGTTLQLGRGLAYCYGERVCGEWTVDFAGQEGGWWGVGVSPDGVLAARGVIHEGLPICVAMIDAEGAVQVVRDIRRHCWPFVWERGDTAWLHTDIPAPFRLRRIQAAVRERCADKWELGWSCSCVTLPTELGAVLDGPLWWRPDFDKDARFGAGLVMEGLAL